jgi:hypothetical protein
LTISLASRVASFPRDFVRLAIVDIISQFPRMENFNFRAQFFFQPTLLQVMGERRLPRQSPKACQIQSWTRSFARRSNLFSIDGRWGSYLSPGAASHGISGCLAAAPLRGSQEGHRLVGPQSPTVAGRFSLCVPGRNDASIRDRRKIDLPAEPSALCPGS